jgi:hypothetical protein
MLTENGPSRRIWSLTLHQEMTKKISFHENTNEC